MSTPYDPLATDELVEDNKLKTEPRKAPNQFARYIRMIYNPIGFKRWYNFIGFFIFGGALFFFCWHEIRKIDVRGYWIKQASPGEIYWFSKPRYSIGMQMHLGCKSIVASSDRRLKVLTWDN